MQKILKQEINYNHYNKTTANYLKIFSGFLFLFFNSLNVWSISQDNHTAEYFFQKGDSLFNKNLFELSYTNFKKAALLYKNENNCEGYLKCMGMAAWTNVQLSKLDNASINFNEALSFCEKKTDPFSESIGRMYNGLGIVNFYKGNYEKALEYSQKSLMIRRKVFGAHHTKIAECYQNMSGAYYRMGDYDLAMSYCLAGIAIDLKILGENHLFIASHYNNFGIFNMQKGNYNEAKKYYLKSLEIYSYNIDTVTPVVSESYNNLGAVCILLKQYPDALLFLEKSLKIRKQIFGENHPDVAEVYTNLGMVYLDLGNKSEASNYYKKSIDLFIKHFGIKHPNTGYAYIQLANLKINNNEYNDGIELFNQAIVSLSNTSIIDVKLNKIEVSKSLSPVYFLDAISGASYSYFKRWEDDNR